MANCFTYFLWLAIATGFLYVSSLPGAQSSSDLSDDEQDSLHGETRIETDSQRRPSLIILKQILLQQHINTCCPDWTNLTQPSLYEDRNNGYNYGYGHRSYVPKPNDLKAEIRRAFFNLTYLSIEGQQGSSERERYYNFYDSLQYYLRLVIVSKQFLASTPIDSPNTTASEAEFARQFTRTLKTISFKMSQDRMLKNFLDEYNSSNGSHNANFDFFEDFITNTNFGHNYLNNITMIKDSESVSEQIYSHLNSIDFPSNFTRPSKQYDIVRGLSQELFRIYHNVESQVEQRIANYRPEMRTMLKRLALITQQRPYVRLLGDIYDPILGPHVIKFTKMLDLFLTNNLTHVSFYRQLLDLPSGFITLGIKIIRDYEEREMEKFPDLGNAYQKLVMKQSESNNK